MKALLLKFAKSRFTAIVTELDDTVGQIHLFAYVIAIGAFLLSFSWFKFAFIASIGIFVVGVSIAALSTLRSWALKAEQEAVAAVTATTSDAVGASPSP
jgi:hypothetical protein